MAKILEDPRIGTVLNGRYRIIQRIASGGMGIVYRGERMELGKPVAIKFIQEFYVTDEKVLARFQREARTMSKLSHPNCVSVIDFGVEDAPYIVMDYATGKTLKKILAVERVSTERAILIGRQLLAGIGHAHGQGIIHRDIKPQNIMLGTATGVGEHVRIFDFGLAKLLDTSEDAFHSVTSVVIGTPHYMAPEQTRSSKVDARADLYSAGVVLFELLTGKRPFAVKEAFEVVRLHREKTPPTLGEVDPKGSFSPELEAVIAKALQKTPDDRFQTADEFLEALNVTPEGAVDEYSRSAETMSLTLEKEKTKPLRPVLPQPLLEWLKTPRVRRMLILAPAFVLMAGLGIWILVGRPQPSPHPKPATMNADAVSAARSQDAASNISQTGDKGAGPGQTGREPESNPETSTDETTLPDPAEHIKTIADARALIEKGDRETAILGLKKLRREDPNNVAIIYLLADQYFEKRWWSDALELYRETIRLDPKYRTNRRLNENAIAALVDDKTARKAQALIIRSIGKAALPHLKQAIRKNESHKVRKRARALSRRLSNKKE